MQANPSARNHLRYAVRVLRDHARNPESIKLLHELANDKNISLEALHNIAHLLAPEDMADTIEAAARFEAVGGYEHLEDGNPCAVILRQDAARQQSIRDTNAYFRLLRENKNARFEVGMGGTEDDTSITEEGGN